MVDATLDALREAWAEARAGSGRLVQVVAPIGGGKTALLGRLREAIGGPGERAAVVSAACGEDQLVHRSDRGILEELVVRVSEGVRAIDASGETERPATSVPWLLPGTDFLAAATGLAVLPEVGPVEETAAPRAPTRAGIFADVLLDVTRAHPVALLVDDAHRADLASRQLLEVLARRLAQNAAHRLLVVVTLPEPLAPTDPDAAARWAPSESGTRVRLGALSADSARDRVNARLATHGEVDPGYREAVIALANGNGRVLDALLALSERMGALRRGNGGGAGDPALSERPEAQALSEVAHGRRPDVPANVRADLRAAAVVGRQFDLELLGHLWDVAADAAQLRIDAMRSTGLVEPRGPASDGLYAFISSEIAAEFRDELPDKTRKSLHARAAAFLRASATPSTSTEAPRFGLDVTETWSESRRRDRRQVEQSERLWMAARQFAHALDHRAAAEAALALGEHLFENGGASLAVRQGRREDRERRQRIYVALTEAGCQLDLARQRHHDTQPDPELLAINVRLTTFRARFKEVMGNYAEARQLAETAVDLGAHLAEPRLRLEAMRVHTEICYAAGDHNAARRALVAILAALQTAPRGDALRVYGWLAEAVARWEWVGLHDRLHPYIIDQLHAADAHREALKAWIERLAAVIEQGPEPNPAPLVEAVVEAARTHHELPYAAETLAYYSAEIAQAVVDSHYDTLSGEFFPPDLFGEGTVPGTPTVHDRLEWPIRLLERAEMLAREADHRIARLRVVDTMLKLVYEARERFGELLDRWMPAYGPERPVRLTELVELLEDGFFGVEHIELLTDREVQLAQQLGLDQVLADTLYDALDRELPAAARRSPTLFEAARQAYRRVGDTYGLLTLMLVEHRYATRAGEDADVILDRGRVLYVDEGRQLSTEQRAFTQMRFGEILLGQERTEEAQAHLEQAIALYDEVGDMERVETVGEVLRDVYKRQGDLGRYRRLRDRFRALEDRSPGVAPLGLELRIEHLLTRARQEADEEKAIEMVGRCVGLFARMPDGTTRVDECFVEISKICRRRADTAQTEAGFRDWLLRSLDAVRTATRTNRALGNFHRLFEEYHELFDDLMGLGDYESYLRARAECRELAFAVGNVNELMYLFREHVPVEEGGAGFDPARLPEARGFFEALLRYLLGLGAEEEASRLRQQFVQFLTAIGETELADHYRDRTPAGGDG